MWCSSNYSGCWVSLWFHWHVQASGMLVSTHFVAQILPSQFPAITTMSLNWELRESQHCQVEAASGSEDARARQLKVQQAL